MARKSDVHIHPLGKARGKGRWCVFVPDLPTQREAERVGRIVAKLLRSELTVHGRNGRIRKKDSFGNDPRRSKG